MTYPRVSILILNWHGLEDTIECLESLKKITYPNYKTIVVDNASGGNDVKVLTKEYGDYIYMIENDENYGFPEGNNIGMRYALSQGTDYLLLLNNDTTVDPEFLSELVKVVEGNPSVGIAGSKIYYYNQPNRIQSAGGKIRWWIGDIENYGAKEEDIGQYDEIAERDFVFGTSFLIKREVIDKISLLDPFFFFGVEEFDYCTRAKRAGFKVTYVPQSEVWHKAGASKAKQSQNPETQKLIKKKAGFALYKYNYRFFRKHCPPVLFIFPFLSCTLLQISSWRRAFQLIRRGEWQTIGLGIKKNVKKYLFHSLFVKFF